MVLHTEPYIYSPHGPVYNARPTTMTPDSDNSGEISHAQVLTDKQPDFHIDWHCAELP
ncbi:hypothetical protein J6590_013826 [Homalodisca vitripennis]|nr:hypothetical protein J6590_013826 [Homalodisca vitripennis]